MSNHVAHAIAASGGVVSRSGSEYRQDSRTGRSGRGQGGRESLTNIACNRCRKTLSTTIFVCSCDCVFCEECTYSHFNNSSACPVCNKSLGANDFMELVIADPSSASEETLKNTFQTLFTKHSSSSNAISHQEMCTRILKSVDDGRRSIRFLLKQFVLESKISGRQSGSVGRAFEALQAELTQLKQASSSQRIQSEQAIADLQRRVQSLSITVQEQQKKIDEKDTQLNQFRKLCTKEGLVRIPTTPGGAGSITSGMSTSNDQNGHGARLAPPIPAFVIQKQAREREKEQALEEISRSRGPLIGERPFSTHNIGGRTDIDSVITPIQVPPPNHHLYNRRSSPSVVPNTPRIRDLSAGSTYVFTSGSNRYANTRKGNGPVPSSSSSRSPLPTSGYGFSRIGERRTTTFSGFGSN